MSVPHRKNEKWKPGVSKATLLLLAGMVWLGIGILLNFLAFSWLSIAKAGIVIPLVCVGLAGAIAIHRFGFLRIVDRNLRRILPMEGPRCLFSFMPWKSYLLVAVMMLMGFVLRHSPHSQTVPGGPLSRHRNRPDSVKLPIPETCDSGDSKGV